MDMDMNDMKQYKKSVFACQRCAWCRTTQYPEQGIDRVCPIYEYNPEKRWEHSFSRGRLALIRGMFEGDLKVCPELAEVFYQCTLCGNCEEVCSANLANELGYEPVRRIPHMKIFEAIRREFVKEGHGPLPAHQPLVNSIKQYDNPWMQPRSARSRWAKKMGVKDASKEKTEVLYFVGCTASYDQKLNLMAVNTAKLLQKAEVDFGILGRDEKCCGSTLLRLGAVDDFRSLAIDNIKIWKEIAPKTIVTSCSGCFKTVKTDYPEVEDLGGIEVVHTVSYLDRLIQEGRLKPSKPLNLRVTYHDPCHLGRANGIYDDPRRILQSIPGVEFVEMTPSGRRSICCGAGGGVRTAFRDLATRIAAGKVEKAKEVGATVIASACPFCEQNIGDAVAAGDSNIQVKDVTELLMESVE